MISLHKKTLRKAIALMGVLMIANGVSGCVVALPPAVQAASFALDGISLAATGKTVSDHALSAVAEKDCAMGRALNGEAICTRDAQLAELNALEKRLNNPNAELIAKTVTPAHEDEDFQRASVQLAESRDEDDELLEGLTEEDLKDLEDWDVANGPML